MTKSSTFSILLFVGLLTSSVLGAQNDLLKGIFEKEAPEFHATILPTNTKGNVQMAIYFTHSKLDELEISFWIKDNGTLLNADGDKLLVSGLQKLGNRQQDTIMISGLKEKHLYTIGADFRRPQALSGKFSSRELKQGYRYTYREPTQPNKARVVDAMTKSPVSSTPVRPSVICQDPIIEVRVDPGGYCGTENRPAVLVQCVNCQGKEWEFSVEVRPAMGRWMPLRYDGKRQPAVGMGLRTEPLCTLSPGTFEVQVLAWGKNCPEPVVKSLPANIVIPHPDLEEPVSARSSTPKSSNKQMEVFKMPDTCFVEGQAALNGKTINGYLTLSPYSPCADLRPYAEVVYVHPGHRNITLEKIPLIPGAEVPFEFPLDVRDMSRGIHTIQVVAYVKENEYADGVPLESFWMRATPPDELSAGLGNDAAMGSSVPASPARPQYTPANGGQTSPYGNDTPISSDTGFAEEGLTTRSATPVPPAAERQESTDDLYIDSNLMESTINEVQVTATDPNCTPIQDLRVVFESNQPDKPLFISWLNPRCCQVEGCTYTVWAGPDPKQLSLLMKGKKSGAIISEVLQGTRAYDKYYEVVVETGNGVRKAAYALGSGPMYGIQEILDYHDLLYPPAPARVEGIIGTPEPEEEEETTIKSGEIESAVLLNPVIPEMPISDFDVCKYRRATRLEGDQPVKAGEEISIKYDFKDDRYRYTLYHLPSGSDEWVIAPGTTELQEDSEFNIKTQPYHAGKYIILSYKPSSNGSGWGCLSMPLDEAIEVEVIE